MAKNKKLLPTIKSNKESLIGFIKKDDVMSPARRYEQNRRRKTAGHNDGDILKTEPHNRLRDKANIQKLMDNTKALSGEDMRLGSEHNDKASSSSFKSTPAESAQDEADWRGQTDAKDKSAMGPGVFEQTWRDDDIFKNPKYS